MCARECMCACVCVCKGERRGTHYTIPLGAILIQRSQGRKMKPAWCMLGGEERYWFKAFQSYDVFNASVLVVVTPVEITTT